MRVLHVIATGQRRGSEVFASELVDALVAEGIEQMVAVLHGGSGVSVPFSVPVVSLDSKTGRRSRLGVESSVISALKALITGWSPDVIQAHGGESLERVVLANSKTRAPVVYRKIGVARRTSPISPRRAAHAFFVRRATKLIAVADAVRENTIALFRVPPNKIITIPNAIDPGRMTPDSSRREIRASLGISPTSHVVLSLGALVWEKEPLTHLTVGERAGRDGIDVVHLFAGDGPLRGQLEEAVRTRGLEDRVILLGARDDVGNLLAASDVMLHASRDNGMEGMPACLIEAGMARLPVCAYSVAGVSEVVESGKTGLLAPPGNVDLLAECALTVLKDDRARWEMGEAARRRCLERFDIGRISASYLSVYRELVATRTNWHGGRQNVTRHELYRVAKLVRENPKVRRVALPTYRRLAKMMVLGRGPRVLINSVPKAGTHVLSTLVRQLQGMTHSGQHYVFDDFRLTEHRPPIWGDIPEVDWDRLRDTFASMPRSQFLTGHLPASPRFLAILRDLDYRTLFIIRDPRDVVVSSALYMSRLKRHVMHHRYAQDFTTDHDRIMATITGFPPSERGRGSESVGERVAKYLPWLHTPGVYCCRFESLIGARGGGRVEAQVEAVSGIAHYLGFDMPPDKIASVARRTWSEGSPTFRRGSIGDWRNHFSNEHKTAFKEIAGEQLIALGYEGDNNW